jgi:hypothetical protein
VTSGGAMPNSRLVTSERSSLPSTDSEDVSAMPDSFYQIRERELL